MDFDDSKSNQIDTIIYSVAMPKIVVANHGVFLREPVFVTIEPKSYLNKDELERTLLSVKSFKALKTTSPQYTPIFATANGKGYTWQKFYDGRASSYIFAYDGLALETVAAHLPEINQKHSISLLTHGPDLVCILNQGVIAKNDGQFLPKQEGAGQFAHHILPKDVLLVLFIHILNTISSFGVLPYNFAQYLSFADLNRIRGL